ncbi:hypothetical protein RJ640_020548 [Escallonia rubra]|uniref:CCHC-type domain-containing protein n=1 Tax=Escallonia rubra TaxID=112253 RepID=A0AA88UV97_9ASTE|nr:hypothetical protein RJ640_020548 [Escallonia rubra]
MSNNTTMKYACEQFDGKTNFGIWQSTVKDILVQQGLLKPLLGNKPESMDQDDWEELQAKAVSTIRGRSRSRNPGHGKNRSKSRGKQDKSSIECWYCKEIGHIARRCPEMKEKKNGKKHVNNANVAEEDDKSSDGDLYLVSSVEQQEGRARFNSSPEANLSSNIVKNAERKISVITTMVVFFQREAQCKADEKQSYEGKTLFLPRERLKQ